MKSSHDGESARGVPIKERGVRGVCFSDKSVILLGSDFFDDET